jgi:hypothetical protein
VPAAERDAPFAPALLKGAEQQQALEEAAAMLSERAMTDRAIGAIGYSGADFILRSLASAHLSPILYPLLCLARLAPDEVRGKCAEENRGHD